MKDRIKIFSITLIICCLFQGFALHGQTNSSIGIHVDGIQATLKGDQFLMLVDQSPKVSISTGLSYQTDINRFLGYTVGINYVNLGTGFKDAENDGVNDLLDKEIDLNASMHYIQLPVSADILILKDRMIYFSSGLYASTLMKGTLKGNLDDYSDLLDETTFNDNITGDFLKIDFGFFYGIGSQLKINDRLRIGAGVKQFYGLIPVNLNNRDFPDYVLKNKYGVLDFNLSYSFRK